MHSIVTAIVVVLACVPAKQESQVMGADVEPDSSLDAVEHIDAHADGADPLDGLLDQLTPTGDVLPSDQLAEATLPDVHPSDATSAELPEQLTEEVAGQCAGVELQGIEQLGGSAFLRYGEVATWSLSGTALSGTSPSLSLEPSDVAATLQDNGDGTISLTHLAGDVSSRTIEVTVSVETCGSSVSAAVTLLGQVLASESTGANAVYAYRSDGEPLGMVIPGTYLNYPRALAILDGGTIAVGCQYIHNVQAYDFEGNQLFVFDEYQANGASVFSAYSIYDIMVHNQTGQVWVFARWGEFSIFEPDGTHVDNLWMKNSVPNCTVTSAVQLPDGSFLTTYLSSSPWAVELYDSEGVLQGPWGSTPDLPLKVYALTRDHQGKIVAAGLMNGAVYVARLKPTGILEESAGPFELANPVHIRAFGDHLLMTTIDTEDKGIVELGPDLELLDEPFVATPTHNLRGLLVL